MTLTIMLAKRTRAKMMLEYMLTKKTLKNVVAPLKLEEVKNFLILVL